MTHSPIAKVTLDPSLGLLITPKAQRDDYYEYIYRTANGVRWNNENHAFCAHEPHRWQVSELLQQIVASVAQEFGEELHFTKETIWQNVPPAIQISLHQLLLSRD